MNTTPENIIAICDEKGNLTGIIRRDPISKKHLVYKAQEATCEEIAGLIEPK